METFTWIPDNNAEEDVTPRVKTATYGDGYEQRVGDGLNTMLSKFNLNFTNRDTTEKSDLVAFLKARGGVEAFNWTPPGETTARVFVSRSWKVVSPAYGLFNISTTFDEVPES